MLLSKRSINLRMVIENFRGEGSLTIFQIEYKAKLEILEGCVKVKNKHQFPWGVMDIFRDHAF